MVDETIDPNPAYYIEACQILGLTKEVSLSYNFDPHASWSVIKNDLISLWVLDKEDQNYKN